MIFIFTTTNKKDIAKKIGKSLLKSRLIACYNLFPVESAYWWKGKIVEDQEFLMILKTKGQNFTQIEKIVKQNHTYEVPEIVAIKAQKVNQDYLNWLLEVK